MIACIFTPGVRAQAAPFRVLHGWGQDSCRLAPFIATHWDSVGNRESPGAGDADGRYLLYPKNGYPWDPGKFPAYDNYHAQRTACTAVNIHRTRDDSGFNMLDTLRLAPGGNGIADAIDRYALDFFRIIVRDPANYDRRTYLDILNYGPYQDKDFYLDTASRNVQILNNVYLYDPVNGVKGLATITLPPFWRKSRKYPIYLHGNGYGIPDNNAQYEGYGKSLLDARMAAYLARNSVDSGIITVSINNGGKESSGANQGLIGNLETFMRQTLPAYGGDTGRVVIAGASRGGLEAAQWGASNAFTAQTILSAVPAIKLGSMAGLSLSTFPQLNVINLPLGSPDAWRRDYASSGNPTGVLGPYKKAQAVSKVLLGDTSLARADSLSLFGIYQRADTARLNRKFIHFSYGSRDAYFPLGYFLQFDSLLTGRGIRHSSHIGYGFGHNIGLWPEYWNSEMTRIAQGRAPGPYLGKTRRFLMPKNLQPGTDPVADTNSAIILSPAWIDTICKYRPGYLSGGKNHSPDSLGFSAVIPYGILKDSSFEIAVTGQWKKPWKLWARYEKGYQEVFSAWGGFGDSIRTSQDGSNSAIRKEGGREFGIIRNLKLSMLDTLEWFFRYDGREIPNRFTPYAHPATGAFQRALSVASAAEPATAMPYQRGFSRPTVCNGADQFHPLLLKANDIAEFLPFGDTTIQLSRQNPIVLRVADHVMAGSDSDAKDTLRYDLLDVAGNYIPSGIMDRKRGEFRLPTSGVAPGGPYTLMAMVSDGKGGSDTAYFRVTLSP